MLAHGEQSVHQALPVWSHWANENWCMIGYHGVSVLADAAAKGMAGVDWDQALKLAVSSSSWPCAPSTPANASACAASASASACSNSASAAAWQLTAVKY